MLFSLLHHRVDWERPYIDTDESKGAKHTFQKQQQDIRCLVQPIATRDKALYGQRNITVSHQIFFDRVLDLQVGDRLIKHATKILAQKIYVIKGWQDQGGQNGRCFMVEALEQV